MYLSVKHWATHLLYEPKFGLLLGNTLEIANSWISGTALGNSLSLAAEDDVEIHTENTGGGIVLDAEVDMLIDTETEVA